MQGRTIVILLGPPGSGKGSQALLLKTELNLPHLSTGDILREQVAKQTSLGKVGKSYIEDGRLVPDGIIVDMLLDRIRQKDCEKGFLLDGFPRTLPQAHILESKLNPADKVFILNFVIQDKAIIARITGRMICSKCSAPYHLIFSPPNIPNTCDICHAELYHRSDDTEAVIKKRLAVYHEQTAPLIAYYKDRPHFVALDATQPKEALLEEIEKILHVTTRH